VEKPMNPLLIWENWYDLSAGQRWWPAHPKNKIMKSCNTGNTKIVMPCSLLHFY